MANAEKEGKRPLIPKALFPLAAADKANKKNTNGPQWMKVNFVLWKGKRVRRDTLLLTGS